jgi:hypothetical protein
MATANTDEKKKKEASFGDAAAASNPAVRQIPTGGRAAPESDGKSDTDLSRKVQDARAQLKAWNERNPDSPIRIQIQQIIKRVNAMSMSKEDRIARTAPKEIKAAVRRELAGNPL